VSMNCTFVKCEQYVNSVIEKWNELLSCYELITIVVIDVHLLSQSIQLLRLSIFRTEGQFKISFEPPSFLKF
jgi:hypothetical protein